MGDLPGCVVFGVCEMGVRHNQQQTSNKQMLTTDQEHNMEAYPSGTYPAITLVQPWATWIMRGWKSIETRRHNRFRSLKHRWILIHAGMKTDEGAAYNKFLTREQILRDPDEVVNGFILGKAFVFDHRMLCPKDSDRALIECNTERYGLILRDVVPFPDPIPAKGSQGVWYYNLDRGEKISKIQHNQQANDWH